MTYSIRKSPKPEPNGYSCYRCGRPATRFIKVGTFSGRKLPVCNSNRH